MEGIYTTRQTPVTPSFTKPFTIRATSEVRAALKNQSNGPVSFEVNAGEKGFFLGPSEDEKHLHSSEYHVYRVSVGPIEMEARVDFNGQVPSDPKIKLLGFLRIIFHPPFGQALLLSSTWGSLSHLIVADTGYEGIVYGNFSLGLVEAEGTAVMSWNFKYYGKEYQGKQEIFKL